jgi:hypothetical protein
MVNGLRFLRKKNQYLYSERDKVLEQQFIHELKTLDPGRAFYFDEPGIDNNDYYPYAYAPRGVEILAKKPGHRTSCLTHFHQVGVEI